MNESESPSDESIPSNNSATDVDYVAHVDLSTAGQECETLTEEHLGRPRRRFRLPIILFLLTCASTFWAGITNWQPVPSFSLFRHLALQNGMQGFIYMACVLAILFAHEMGHFIATIVHRIPASPPFFIPFPFSPLGTMGAVIAMDGRQADRKEIFDIGLAGPLAGLVFAIPILIFGIMKLKLNGVSYGETYDCPLLAEWLIRWIHPDAVHVDTISNYQLNPYFMAGWVGLFITGLNMMPVSQLDGGHVIYTLFLKKAHIVARGFIFLAIMFIVFADAQVWTVMVVLVILMGTDHPKTKNDNVPLGLPRTILGLCSLAIPILCFPPKLMDM